MVPSWSVYGLFLRVVVWGRVLGFLVGFSGVLFRVVFVIGRSWFLRCGCMFCGLPGLRFLVVLCVAWVGFRGHFGV